MLTNAVDSISYELNRRESIDLLIELHLSNLNSSTLSCVTDDIFNFARDLHFE